jgi:hypothetical protein
VILKNFRGLCPLDHQERGGDPFQNVDKFTPTEKDILVQLSADELVSKFAAAVDRRLDLEQTFMCTLLNGSRLQTTFSFRFCNHK